MIFSVTQLKTTKPGIRGNSYSLAYVFVPLNLRPRLLLGDEDSILFYASKWSSFADPLY